MSLATARETGPRNLTRGPACGVGRTIQVLTEKADTDEQASIDLANLYLILDDPQWTAEDIAYELRDTGYNVQGPTVARHRRGGCKCEAL